MTKRTPWIVVLVTLGFAAVAACDGEVTEEDLQLWTHNERGLSRLGEVIADPEQPMTTRIRGLEVVIEQGHSTRVRAILDEVTDNREALISGIGEQLLDHLAQRDEVQLNAKDALIVMQRFIPVEEFRVIRQKIGQWAFGDITWDSQAEDVQGLGNRISAGQIKDLGEYGWEGGAIIISHGFLVDKMMELLVDARDPRASQLLLKGIKKLHVGGQVGIHHLAALARTESPEAAGYMLDVYLNAKYDKEVRSTAFNNAVLLLDLPGVKKSGATLVGRLLKLMALKNPQDRWLGAINIIHVHGVERLEDILANFKADLDYTEAEESPLKSVMDLCLDIRDKGHGAKAVPVFMKHATDANPVVAAISVVCLKANQAHLSGPVLQTLATPGKKAPPVTLEKFLGGELNLASLAQNAIEGLAMMKTADADKKAGKLDDRGHKDKMDLITFELEKLGEEYTKVVADRFEDAVEMRKAEDEAKAACVAAIAACSTSNPDDATGVIACLSLMANDQEKGEDCRKRAKTEVKTAEEAREATPAAAPDAANAAAGAVP